jgi:CDP-diacylglycerol--glycerol-3-phosphate 3-phosphatidyltransferase
MLIAMGFYSARDLVLGPTILSLSRLPLAAVFPFVVDRPLVATAVLVMSALTDVLDGYWARRANRVTATGAAVDPVTDKIFVITVVISLVVTGRLAPSSVAWMSTRELGELPLVLWLVISRSARRARTEHPHANALGKLATTLQFATIACALWQLPETRLMVAATAIAGSIAAVSYWLRAIRSAAPVASS